MNTREDSAIPDRPEPSIAISNRHPAALLPLLVKREYWEHRGGFLWAPIWAGGALLFLLVSATVFGEIFGAQHMQMGIPLQTLFNVTSPAELATIAVALNGALFGFAGFVQVVLAFVLFFYLLGALYDDRRDRSVLFWKSLPISDTATVASKVLAAAVLAPLLAFAVTVVLHLAVLLLLSLLVLFHGGNPLTLVWGTASPWVVWSKLLVMIPINALWALPAYGWLLLVSAFARSKPFLWAVVPPVLVGWLLLLSGQDWPPRIWYWRDVVGRILLSVVPGSWAWHDAWLNHLGANAVHFGPHTSVGLGSTLDSIAWNVIGNALASPSLWIGVVAGLLLLAAAIWLRGRRIETSS